MRVFELLNILKCVDMQAEVMLQNTDWGYRDKECFISTVETDTNNVTLHFDTRPIPCDTSEDCDSCENS